MWAVEPDQPQETQKETVSRKKFYLEKIPRAVRGFRGLRQPMLPGETAEETFDLGVETAPPLRRTAASTSIAIEDAPGRRRAPIQGLI
jgi:hypothetical protein